VASSLLEDHTAPAGYMSRHALIVGIDAYENPGWPDLSYAVADAQAVRDALVQDYDFAEEDVLLLLDGAATRDAISSALEDWAGNPDRVGKDDLFVFFFAGHGETRNLGARGQRGYLVPVDGSRREDGNPSFSSLTSMADLEEVSEAVPAKHALFVLDCCFSGLVLTRSAPPSVPGLGHRARQVLTAGDGDQVVLDSGGSGHSVFTGSLLEALDGRGDSNSDGAVSFGEMYQYVNASVRQRTGERQTPLQTTFRDHEGGNVSLIDETRRALLSDSPGSAIHPRLDTAAQQTYVSILSSADAQRRLGLLAESRSLLELVPFVQRGWEWRALQRSMNHSTGRLDLDWQIGSLNTSADGQQLQIATNGKGYLVERDSFEVVREIDLASEIDAAELEVINITPDGLFLVVHNRLEARLELRHSESGEFIEPIGHFSPGTPQVVFSIGGERLAYNSKVPPKAQVPYDKDLVVWDLATRESVLRIPNAHHIPIALSASGQVLYAGGIQSWSWDVDTGGLLTDFTPVGDAFIYSMTCSPDDRLLALGASGGAQVYSRDSDQLAWRAVASGNTAVAFSPDSRLLATGSGDGIVRIFDAVDGAPRAVLLGHSDSVEQITFLGADELATASRDGTVRRWGTSEPGLITRIDSGSPRLRSFDLSPDGSQLAIASWYPNSHPIQLVDARTGEEGVPIRTEHAAANVAWHPNGRLLAASSGRTTRLFDSELGHETTSFSLFDEDGRDMQFSPGVHLAFTRAGEWILVGASLVDALGSFAGFQLGAWSLDGGDWNAVRLFDKRLRDLDCSTVRNVCAVAQTDQVILLDDKLRTVAVLPAPNVEVIRLDPAGTLLAAGTSDGSTLILDLESGETLARLDKHARSVKCLEWSPDGLRLATGSEDGTVRIWDPRGGVSLLVLTTAHQSVEAIHWNPANDRLLVGTSQGEIREY
jgi:WD40 repeat protein/uncharacterized caspase-like protein